MKSRDNHLCQQNTRPGNKHDSPLAKCRLLRRRRRSRAPTGGRADKEHYEAQRGGGRGEGDLGNALFESLHSFDGSDLGWDWQDEKRGETGKVNRKRRCRVICSHPRSGEVNLYSLAINKRTKLFNRKNEIGSVGPPRKRSLNQILGRTD